MAVIPVGYAQVNCIMGGASLPLGAQVTFGQDISEYAGDPLDLADLWIQLWDNSVAPIITDGFQLQSVLVKYGPNLTGPSAELAGVVNGEDSGVGCPPNTAWLVTKGTASGGRAGRGRFYLPGIRETQVDAAGGINSTWQGVAQTNMDDVLEAWVTADAPLVVLHGESSPISTPTPVTSLVVQGKVATQRRRLRK